MPRPKIPTTLLVAAALTAAAVTATACSSSTGASGTTGGSSGKHYTVAFIPGCTCDPYYSTETSGFQAAAKKAGVTTLIQGPADFQAAEQIPVLQAVVQRKPDAIVIDPTDATALAAPIDAAIAQGIPVMTTGNNVNTDKPFTAIAASSIEGGKLGAQTLMRQAPQGGEVLFVHIKPGISSIDDREKGFRQAMRGNSKFTVLPNVYAGNDSATQAAGLVSAVISAHPNLVGIFASNVITAEGTADAIATAGKVGKIKAIGYDAGAQEVTDLKAGSLTAVISQNPYQIGQLAVQNAVKYLDGKKVPKNQPQTPLVITQDNMGTPAAQQGIYK
jgi:ribose transport system substrate-binding protein